MFFFFQAEDGIRDADVTEFRRVLFRSALVALNDMDSTTKVIEYWEENVNSDNFILSLAALYVLQERNQPEQFITVAKKANEDRKSTRLNSSHVRISYAVFCLKKKKKTKH